MAKKVFSSEVQRAQAIAHLGDALFSMHSECGYNAPDDIRRAIEHRLRTYLNDTHTGCARCDADENLLRTIEAATAVEDPKPAAPVVQLAKK